MWNFLFYEPILNGLIWIYQNIAAQNLGWAIILLTIFIRVILLPLTYKGRKNQAKIRKIQPEMERIKKKYENNKEKLQAEYMKLYSKYEVNPVMGCLPLLLQLPYFWALSRILFRDIKPDNLVVLNEHLYSFLPPLEKINAQFFWLDLTQADPLYILPFLVAGFQFLQTYLMTQSTQTNEGSMNKSLLYMPLIMLFVAISFPSGLSLYIITTAIMGIFEELALRNFLTDSEGKKENNIKRKQK